VSEIVASGVDRTEGPREFGYVVVWTADAYRFHFTAFAIMSLREAPDTGLYTVPSMRSSVHGETEDPAQAAPSLGGFIKWDGCSEIEFHDSPHWCGAHYFVQHIRLMAWLLNKAAETLHANWFDDTIRLDVAVVEGKP